MHLERRNLRESSGPREAVPPGSLVHPQPLSELHTWYVQGAWNGLMISLYLKMISLYLRWIRACKNHSCSFFGLVCSLEPAAVRSWTPPAGREIGRASCRERV